MQLTKFNSVDEIQISLLGSLVSDGSSVNVRQMNTLEIHPAAFVLTNPRARCITNTARKWSLPLAIGEFAWHLSASNDVKFISYYAKQWMNFSEDGKVIKESCYGHKIFKKDNNGISQWDSIVNLLSEDPTTRRAVLLLYDSATNFGPYSKDVSCICTIQFLIRDNKLDAITHMRSNDVIWGLPYDLFLVTMLQEYLSIELSVQLGSYYHFANSMHLYERHFNLANNILRSDHNTFEMPSMTHIDQMQYFLENEKALRNGSEVLIETDSSSDYWNDLLKVLGMYRSEKKLAGLKNTLNFNSPYDYFIDLLKPVFTQKT